MRSIKRHVQHNVTRCWWTVRQKNIRNILIYLASCIYIWPNTHLILRYALACERACKKCIGRVLELSICFLSIGKWPWQLLFWTHHHGKFRRIAQYKEVLTFWCGVNWPWIDWRTMKFINQFTWQCQLFGQSHKSNLKFRIIVRKTRIWKIMFVLSTWEWQ